MKLNKSLLNYKPKSYISNRGKVFFLFFFFLNGIKQKLTKQRKGFFFFFWGMKLNKSLLNYKPKSYISNRGKVFFFFFFCNGIKQKFTKLQAKIRKGFFFLFLKAFLHTN
ncbi:hypothetical protein CsatA_003485 [Cannabis sativa]